MELESAAAVFTQPRQFAESDFRIQRSVLSD